MLKRIKKMLTNKPVQDTVTEKVAELKPMEPTNEEVFEAQVKAREEGLAAAENIDEVPDSDDEYISDEDISLIGNQFEKFSVKTVLNSGHWLHAENPEGFFTEILNFLNWLSNFLNLCTPLKLLYFCHPIFNSL